MAVSQAKGKHVMKRLWLCGVTAMVMAFTALLAGPASAGPTTKVNLRVSGCPACEVVVYKGRAQFTSVRLSGGKGSFKVPRAANDRLWYELISPRSDDPWSATAMVTAYAGKRKGTKVGSPQAKRGKSGYVCSYLPNRKSVTVKAKVDHYRLYDRTFKRDYTTTRFWASPTLKAKSGGSGLVDLSRGRAGFNGNISC